MPAMKDLERTFDTVASTYEKWRPGYSDELYEMLFDYIPISQSSNVVEVGIGGGQATLPILRTGCNLTAIEYGEQFSKLCKEKFSDYPQFKVITNKFEDTNLEDGVYDLVYSASAFHWVSEDVGYSKVFLMLRNSGVFARFANHPYRDKGNPTLSQEIDKIYAQYHYKYYDKTPEIPTEYTEEEAKTKVLIAFYKGEKRNVLHRCRFRYISSKITVDGGKW